MSDHGTAVADNVRGFGDDVSERLSGADAAAAGRTVRDQATSLRDQATEQLRNFAGLGRDQVVNSLDGIVDAARDIAEKIGGKGGPLGDYAHTAVDTLESWADTVKDKSLEDLLDSGRDFARRSPAAAVGIAVAAGFVLSRLFKASGGNAA